MKNVQLVIPMAGLGSRFAKAGYKTLKPLIPIHGRPMISVVLANLMSPSISHVILVCQRETMESVDLRSLANVGDARLSILCVDALTDGPAGTLEVAKPALNMQEPLVVANSDQYIDASMEDFYADLFNNTFDGEILAMRDNDPKWSFARTDDEGLLLEVKEKVVISDLATVGIYGFTTAGLAFEAIQRMRKAGDRTNGEYYVGPCYNYLVDTGKKVFVRDLGPVSNVMHGLGIPEDLDLFLAKSVSQRASQAVR